MDPTYATDWLWWYALTGAGLLMLLPVLGLGVAVGIGIGRRREREKATAMIRGMIAQGNRAADEMEGRFLVAPRAGRT